MGLKAVVTEILLRDLFWVLCSFPDGQQTEGKIRYFGALGVLDDPWPLDEKI